MKFCKNQLDSLGLSEAVLMIAVNVLKFCTPNFLTKWLVQSV